MAAPSVPPSKARPEGVGVPLVPIALVGVTTLLIEILLTRIFSITLWYHFAFFAISLALFGIAASGVVVALSPPFSRRGRALTLMGLSSACFGLAIPAAFFVEQRIPFIPFDVPGRGIAALAFFTARFLVLSIPFFFSGLTLAIAFTNDPPRVNRIYFADLGGGGLGCMLVVPSLLVLSGPGALTAAAALPLIASALFFRRAGSRRGSLFALTSLILMLALVPLHQTLEVFQISHVKSYAQDRGQERERPKLYERWHPVSRIAVHPEAVSQSPLGWFYGDSIDFEFPPVLEVTNDGGARTFIYHDLPRESYAQLFRRDVSDLVYSLTTRPEVLVIGVGGGKDVLAALSLGATSVTGVELNPIMIDVVQDEFAEFSGRPYEDERVEIVIDEGRNFVASREARYDVIKIAATDTWVASARGAYSLTENYLYTREALRDFMHHLNPGGFLSLTRWYPQETLRLTALVTESLKELGYPQPASQVLMVRNEATLTLIVKNGLLSEEESSRFARAAERAGLVVVYPEGAGTRGRDRIDAYHGAVLDGSGLDGLAEGLSLKLEPPTDDRPFFFDLFRDRSGGTLRFGPSYLIQHARASRLLESLVFITIDVALIFVIAPLVVFRRRFADSVGKRTWLIANTYFLAIGFGYLLVEIPLMQRFILFLGHPIYALTVVLFTLLVASGVGSLATQSLPLRGGLHGSYIVAGAAALVALTTLILPGLFESLIGLPIAARITASVATLFPVGFLLGVPFPTGLRSAHRISSTLVPWAWAVNGAASVAAPAVAMLLSLRFGFSMTLYAGVAAYAAAALLLVFFSPRASLGAT